MKTTQMKKLNLISVPGKKKESEIIRGYKTTPKPAVKTVKVKK